MNFFINHTAARFSTLALAFIALSLLAAHLAFAGASSEAPTRSSMMSGDFHAAEGMGAQPLLNGDAFARVEAHRSTANVTTVQAQVDANVRGKIEIHTHVTFSCEGDDTTHSVMQEKTHYHWMEAGETYAFETPELAPMSCDLVGREGAAIAVKGIYMQAALTDAQGEILRMSEAQLH